MNKEWKHYTSVRDLDHLEVLKALFFNHAFGRHYHEGYAIGIILKGSETYQCGGRINIAPKGSIVVVNPGEVHNGQASNQEDGWGYFMIYPRLSLVEKALRHLDMDEKRLPWFKDSVIFDNAFGQILCRFMAAFEAGDSKLALEAHFLELLMILLKHHAHFPLPRKRTGKDQGKVRQVTDLIHADFSENLSLESLAGNVGLSPYALLRLFNRETGMSPYLLQTGLRIRKAKELLRSGHTLADAAAGCGFTDQSHMTRQFKRWLGVTPGEYFRAG